VIGLLEVGIVLSELLVFFGKSLACKFVCQL